MCIRLSLLVVCLSIAACANPSVDHSSPIAPSMVESPSQRIVDAPRLLAPDNVLVEQFNTQIDHAMRKAFRVTGAGLVARTVVDNLVVVPISTRPAGTYIAPALGGNQIEVPADKSVARFTINLDLAEKLAVGKTLNWKICFSLDGGQTWPAGQCFGASWLSYGPGGYFDTINGVQNPDPYREITIAGRAGQNIQGTFILNQQMEAGLTIDVR